jgi:hypothetical protein
LLVTKLEEEEETKVVTKEDFELLAVIGRGAAGKVMMVITRSKFILISRSEKEIQVNHLLMVMIGEGEIFAMKVIRKDKIIARSQAVHCQVIL